MASATSGRTLAAVMFTDMVASTSIAEELGDRRWKALVNRHHAIVRRELKRFGGRELDTAGDGFFASFKEPASAIACACATSAAVQDAGVDIRAGVHFGECERIGKRPGGITVVVASRIMALGGPGDVLISSTAAELTRGAGFTVGDRGLHELKGVDDRWHVFAVTAVDGQPRPAPLETDEARRRRADVIDEHRGSRRWRVVLAAAVAVGVAGSALAAVVGSRHSALVPTANSVSRIDAGSRSFAASFPIAAAHNPPALTVGAGSLWLGDVDSRTVSQLDATDGHTVRTFGTASPPTGLAFADGQLWVSYGNSSQAGSRLGQLPRGDAVDARLMAAPFDVPAGSFPLAAGSGSVWVADWLGSTLTQYDTSTGRTSHVELPADIGPVGLALDSSSDALWIAAGRAPGVIRVDTSGAGRPLQQFGIGAGAATALSVAPDGSVWVTTESNDAVVELSGSGVTRLQHSFGSACDAPSAVLATAGTVWVSCAGSEAVVGLSPDDGSIVATLPVGGVPGAISLGAGGSIWVAVGSRQ
jgi:class 3 adenylate cyclase/streptogramin lyase